MLVLKLNFLSGVPGEIRTHDPLLRRQPLYPAELQGQAIDYSNLTLVELKVKANWKSGLKSFLDNRLSGLLVLIII